MDSLSIRFFFLFLSALPKKRELNFRLPGIESIVKIANLKINAPCKYAAGIKTTKQ